MKTSNLLACTAIGLSLAGCANDEAHKCHEPGTFASYERCSPVQVGTGVDASNAVQARIEAGLRKDDGIAVDVLSGGSDGPLGSAITITAKPGDPSGVFVVSRDHWLPQETADQLVAREESLVPDHVNRVMALIKDIHEWQDAHPRSATVTAPKPIAPEAKPSGGDDRFPSLKWTMSWLPIWTTSTLAGFLGAKAQVVRRVRRGARALVQLPVRAVRRRRERRKELAQRAIDEARLAESGDSRGIYGTYTPVDLEKL